MPKDKNRARAQEVEDPFGVKSKAEQLLKCRAAHQHGNREQALHDNGNRWRAECRVHFGERFREVAIARRSKGNASAGHGAAIQSRKHRQAHADEDHGYSSSADPTHRIERRAR